MAKKGADRTIKYWKILVKTYYLFPYRGQTYAKKKSAQDSKYPKQQRDSSLSLPSRTPMVAKIVVTATAAAVIILSLLSVTSVEAQQVALQLYDNAALAGTPIQELDHYNVYETVHLPNSTASIRLVASIDVSTMIHDAISVECSSSATRMPFMLWLDDHLVCQSGFYNSSSSNRYQMDGSSKTPIVILPHSRKEWTLYGEIWPRNKTNRSFSLEHDILLKMTTQQHPSINLLSWLRPTIPVVELKRLELTKQLQSGWGLYNHHSLQETILLPEGIRLGWTFCHNETNCELEPKIPSTVLPRRHSSHTTQKEEMEFDVAFPESSLTLRVRYDFDGEEMDLVFQTLSTNQEDHSHSSLRVWADIAYVPARSGTVEQGSANSLTVHATGLRSVSFTAFTEPNLLLPPPATATASRSSRSSSSSGSETMIHLRLPAPGSAITITTRTKNPTNENDNFKEIWRPLGMQQDHIPNDRFREVTMGIDAAIYYNLIYVPTERSLIAPVSRGWGKALCMPALRPEMEYVIFDWDNILVAYMMAKTNKKELAYSSLIQTVRSRTAKGFVPNFSAGGSKSQDRSEPPLGAKVLEEIYGKYSETWLVELLWDDLAVQVDWFWSNRRLDGFIVLGSDPVAYPNGHSTNTMQGARYESGLDNSPMYDGNFFRNGLMQLYDVGMTSLVLQECLSLVNLSKVIGRNASELEYRSEVLRESLEKLWDADDGVFSNQFPNGTYSKRISPTSFYPLLGNVASDAQAESMVEHWLMNSTRFCIGSRTRECWWGLPSISGDDPAFPKLGYWRGYVWGPMSLLTYWALGNYQHIPQVALAQKQLATQMTDMFLELWRTKGRVCENYSPHRDATDCTGDKFYHWGALAGLLALLEQEKVEQLTSSNYTIYNRVS
eukprot:scaffold19016_cov147-Cylindrotheca_fusiformis.AAC.5